MGGERGGKGARAAGEAVQGEWARRVQAEYGSAAIAQNLTLWLLQLGAPIEVLRDGLRIVDDELTHAELSHRTYLAAGGQGAAPLQPSSLSLARNPEEPLEIAVGRVAVQVFCLGETVAVRLFKVLREGCSVKPARRTLDRVLRDEVRHRDFGWALLDMLLEMPAATALRGLVARELPGMLAQLRTGYAGVTGGDGGDEGEMSPEDRAWGLMPVARYGEIVAQAVSRDYVPRFRARGIDAQGAWEIALRTPPEGGYPGARAGAV